MRAELKSVRRELKETKQQKASAKQTYEWKANSTMCTVPSSNNYKTYDYQRALQAAGRMTEDVKMQDPVEPAEKRRKLMQRSLLKNTKKVFVADEDILRKVDKSLANYAEDPGNRSSNYASMRVLQILYQAKFWLNHRLLNQTRKEKDPMMKVQL